MAPTAVRHITDHYGPFRDFLPQASRWLDTALPLPADDDHGDFPAAATLVPAPSSTGGTLERNGDSDWFRIDLAMDDALRVRTTGPTDTYGRLSVAGSDFTREDDDSGTDSNFEILVLEAQAGTWYIEVSGADTETTGPTPCMPKRRHPPSTSFRWSARRPTSGSRALSESSTSRIAAAAWTSTPSTTPAGVSDPSPSRWERECRRASTPGTWNGETLREASPKGLVRAAATGGWSYAPTWISRRGRTCVGTAS